MSKNNESILVIDDAQNTLEILERWLTNYGYTVYTSTSVESGIEVLDNTTIDLVITDLKMPKVSGLEMVQYVKENYKDVEIIMITGYASIEGAVEAVKAGAQEYLAKPFTEDELLQAVNNALEKLHMHVSGNIEKDVVAEEYGIIGQSPAIKQVFQSIKKASVTSATVLITGESGTGKELVARAIHYNSDRASSSFVPVNCGGIPENLLESELFGHVKGSFTGANETRAGFFQTAEGGTIFLDEISETSMTMQVKLLRVLQDKRVFMVGSKRSQKVDLRIVAATNKNLREIVKKGYFREDLFYRLNVLAIDVPPLRERGDDILILINHFAKRFSEELGKQKPTFSQKSLEILKNYYWPGNVRELENMIQRIIVMTDSDKIKVPDLPALLRCSAPAKRDLNRTLEEVEAEYIKNVLQHVDGNKTKAAKILDIDRKTLRNKLKNYKKSKQN
ncbi:MAG: sigma-54-dependent Fis family transcriptional regulator [Candidatus Cloacimonetes bacterium]|nr:sigma-54-dependent Fis family transcriptional regulator [Candidatus Cloacimonadota bacterium]MBS3767397.1 sigma-54-dependent Fis family transcriptional regulator [Candidatus Cloacimonadota bacterium]